MFTIVEANKDAPGEWEIEHAYGYRTSDCQQNLRYNANGEAVYMTAALGVVMNTDTCEQKFFGGKKVKMSHRNDGDDLDYHRDDIISIDISTDRKTVVTGETGAKPKVCVWNAETGEPIMHYELAAGSRGISAISISPCGRYVATADLHNDHRVTVYNIQRQKQLLQMNGATDRIFDVCWSKRPDDLRFATGT